MKMLLSWIASAVSIFIAAQFVPGIFVASWGVAFWVALVLGLVNVLIKPIILILTLPLNILTLGLFTFVINGLMVMLTASIVPGFRATFWAAIIFSIAISLVSFLLRSIFGQR